MLHRWGQKRKKKIKHVLYAVAWEELTSSRLSLMHTVREIRLQVSAVVNGSHCSPLLMADRKSQQSPPPLPSDHNDDQGLTCYCGQSAHTHVHHPPKVMWEHIWAEVELTVL